MEPVQTRGGEQPFTFLIEGLLMVDTLCHTWDLARAVGSDEKLNEAAVATAHKRLIEAGALIRGANGFKYPVESRPEADAQTTFLNFTGRVV